MNKTPLDLEQALASLAQMLSSKLLALGEKKLSKQLQIHWNGRLRSTAGRAWPKELRIELNPRLLLLADANYQLQRTALHEAAHLLAYLRHPRRRIQAHGREWQQACADLGIAGELATHQLPLPRQSQRRKYQYQCPKCEEIFPRVRPIKRPTACAKCCQKYANNRYDERFRLKLIANDLGASLSTSFCR